MNNPELMKTTNFKQRIIDFVDAIINDKKEVLKDIFIVGLVAQFVNDHQISDSSHFIHVNISEEMLKSLKSQVNEQFGSSNLSGSFVKLNDWYFDARINDNYKLEFELVIKELKYIDKSITPPLIDYVKDLKIRKKLLELETFLKVQKWQETHPMDEGFEAIEKERNAQSQNISCNIRNNAEIRDISLISMHMEDASHNSDIVSISSTNIRKSTNNQSPSKKMASPILTKPDAQQLSQDQNLVDEILIGVQQEEESENDWDSNQDRSLIGIFKETISKRNVQEIEQQMKAQPKRRNFEGFMEHQNDVLSSLEQEKISKLSKKPKLSWGLNYSANQEALKKSREERDNKSKKYEKDDLLHYLAPSLEAKSDFSFAHESQDILAVQEKFPPIKSYKSIKEGKAQSLSELLPQQKGKKMPEKLPSSSSRGVQQHVKEPESLIDLSKFPSISEIRKCIVEANRPESAASLDEPVKIQDEEKQKYPSISSILGKKTTNNMNKKESIEEITGCVSLDFLKEFFGKNKK